MKTIADIDVNFRVGSGLDRDDLKFYRAGEGPLAVFGVFYEDGRFRRMPEKTAKAVSEGVHFLHANTAGGRVRFRTNSTCVAISAVIESTNKYPCFAPSGSLGFDLYENDLYKGAFPPPRDRDISDGSGSLEGLLELGNDAWKTVTVDMPTYADVKELYIGVGEGASLEPAPPYRDLPPVVYYGSSITQGGCASRPGMAYPNVLSRRLGVDHVNLGFSGSAKGEDAMAEYIAGLDMSVFVYDYDYNAPSAEHLEKTHGRMFRTIRAAHPDLPVIMMSRPKCALKDVEKQRMEIIRATYDAAVAAGDKNVHFLSGAELMKRCGDEGTVEGIHCTDLGFFSIAEALEPLLRRLLDAAAGRRD